MNMLDDQKIFIDASTFLSMHSNDERQRQQAVNFFSSLFDRKIYMSLEQVGLCDDIIWSFSRQTQDSYYPFMDRLHSELNIERMSYGFSDIRSALSKKEFGEISPKHAMLLAQVINNKGFLITCNAELLSNSSAKRYVGAIPITSKSYFATVMQNYYERSCVLNVDSDKLIHV